MYLRHVILNGINVYLLLLYLTALLCDVSMYK